MKAYVEFMTDDPSDDYIMAAPRMIRFPLYDIDLREIGTFTRANVAQWLENWRENYGSNLDPYSSISRIEDFHAVCDDVNIPWDTEKGRLAWEKVHGYRV